MIANLAGGGSDDPERVIVAGPAAAERVEPIEQLGTAIGIELDVTTAPDDAAAEGAVIDEDADVAVLADGTALATREEPGDTSRLGAVVNALRADLALQNGLRNAGLDPQQVADVRATQPPPVEVLRPGDEVDSSRTGVATITNILLFLMLQTYGAWVLTAVLREKASRAVEVLLAVIRPIHLLAGKIIGIGLAALRPCRAADPHGVHHDARGGCRDHRRPAHQRPRRRAVWFILGYALYCVRCGGLAVRSRRGRPGRIVPDHAAAAVRDIVLPAASGPNTLLWVLAFIPPTAVLAMPTPTPSAPPPCGPCSSAWP